MSMGQPIRVMIVDDHTMLRHGLTTVLKSYDDITVVGEAASGDTAIELCAQLLPDVMLMDILLPGMDGVATTRIIRERHPQVQIIMLTSFEEYALVQAALNAGAVGYLLKDLSAEELIRAIRNAHGGQVTLSPSAVKALVDGEKQQQPGHDLTRRERDVLELMIDGLSNTAIADRLVVNTSTIKTHVSNILTKLGATSRTEAVAIALRHHIIA